MEIEPYIFWIIVGVCAFNAVLLFIVIIYFCCYKSNLKKLLINAKVIGDRRKALTTDIERQNVSSRFSDSDDEQDDDDDDDDDDGYTNLKSSKKKPIQSVSVAVTQQQQQSEQKRTGDFSKRTNNKTLMTRNDSPQTYFSDNDDLNETQITQSKINSNKPKNQLPPIYQQQQQQQQQKKPPIAYKMNTYNTHVGSIESDDDYEATNTNATAAASMPVNAGPNRTNHVAATRYTRQPPFSNAMPDYTRQQQQQQQQQYSGSEMSPRKPRQNSLRPAKYKRQSPTYEH